ncbi:branched-chain amino acid ABC transporter permease [Pseudoroseicyclus sp. H15]
MRNGALILGLLALLLALLFVLPAYPLAALVRVMLLATFAVGFNIAFGYTGLLSLGHALFFAAGMYAAGLPAYHLGWGAVPALLAGIAAGGLVAAVTGALALRTKGVSFMIVTLMFAQAGYLTIIYFTRITRGEEGLVLPAAARQLPGLDLSQEAPRYIFALILLGVAMLAAYALVASRFGRVMVAMRENEERSRMLGYNPFTTKLAAFTASGLICGAAGAGWALSFGYIGAGFAGIQYSILPLLYVLLGGAGTLLGPFLGALIMFYLVDLTSEVTDAYLFVVGAALVLLVLFAPKGLLGAVRDRWAPWLR